MTINGNLLIFFIFSLFYSIKWNLYNQSELFRLVFIRNETNDF
jgi:hypothetical protein